MAQPREELRREHQRLADAFEAGEIAERDHDAIRKLVAAYDEESFNTPIPTKESGQQKSPREPYTLANWLRYLRLAAQEICLKEADKKTVNEYTQSLLKYQELQRGSVRNYQSVLRRFYNYHEELEVDRTDVHRLQQEGTPVEPTDLLTQNEIHEIRQATDHARDLALFDMLLYTGQRSMAIRTLRNKDIDFEGGRFKLNDDVDGLKGANDHIRWRSLLLAESSLSDWVNKYHPTPQPNHYVFTAKGIYNDPDPTTPLTRGAPQQVMDNLKNRTGIEKPLHPHMLRHNFVNLAINEYDMDPHYVKLYIGHSPDSRVMESTYQHLTDQDVSAKAEEAFGLADDEKDDESPLTPSQCPRCDEPLPKNAKACPRCGLLITPDAQSAQNEIQEQAEARISEVQNQTEAKIVQSVLEDVRENPDEYIND